ncbi:modification methylase FokI, partial [mine drainage metagenome]
MRYIGSKASTLPIVRSIILRYAGDSRRLCDPFGGVGTVSAGFRAIGYDVWTGDTLTFAHYFQRCRVGISRFPAFSGLRQVMGLTARDQIESALNSGESKRGWLLREYSTRRRFFTESNARRIEYCRSTILAWMEWGLLSEEEYVLL